MTGNTLGTHFGRTEASSLLVGKRTRSLPLCERDRRYHVETDSSITNEVKFPTTPNNIQWANVVGRFGVASSLIFCTCALVMAILFRDWSKSGLHQNFDGSLQGLHLDQVGKAIPEATSDQLLEKKDSFFVVEEEQEEWKPLTESTRRCDWVIKVFTERDEGCCTHDELREKYNIQSTDANVFYRATAVIMWMDFVKDGGNDAFVHLGLNATHRDGRPLGAKSTWTWVTGDQHLSNFGAWRNRHRDVVYSVNDFDEAAIFDFHIDVIRIAVSVCNHAYTNGLEKHAVKHVMRAFTDTYVETVVGYVGNEDALLYELTPRTAKGTLQEYLQYVEEKKSPEKQLEKFTDIEDGTGKRLFIKNEKTRLVSVSPEIDVKIREQFTSRRYGATMLKTGWNVREWNDEYFEVLDVAARVGSGIGSYGVDRYYVLLKGEDGLLGEDGQDGAAVILDVKKEPTPAVTRVLNKDDAAWYNAMFPNEAARTVEAQRRLTSYVDPFTGWIILDGVSFVVRQRSPWKNTPDLSYMRDRNVFRDYMQQVAIATATSHVRGTVGKAPAEFKHVIASVLGNKTAKKTWGKAIWRVASVYHEQVLLDFQCFQDYVRANYS